MNLALALLVTIAFALPVAAQQGLHNDTKRFTDPAAMTEADWTDPAEMARSWAAAIIRMPTGKGRSKSASLADLAQDTGRKYPTVIYLHGCSGIWRGTHDRVKFLADNGFLVIAPASFARAKYPQSCDTARHRGSMYRGTLRIRQADAGYAVERARTLPVVDASRMVLMGLSEGAITTATFRASNERQKVSARVVEGWTCRAGWGEYAGLHAPASEPVLTLVGRNDPWFQSPYTRGDCSGAINRSNGSRSIVYEDGPLADRHELLDRPEPRQAVLDFLQMLRP